MQAMKSLHHMHTRLTYIGLFLHWPIDIGLHAPYNSQATTNLAMPYNMLQRVILGIHLAVLPYTQDPY